MAGKLIHARLRPAAEAKVRSGHPWIFSGSITAQNRAGEAGELVTIFDRKNEFLAIGLFDPNSPIRVRVLRAGSPAKIDAEFWKQRLLTAVSKRNSLEPATTGFRIVHGESDGFPALVVDRYSTTVVVKLYSEVWFPFFGKLIPLLKETLQPERVICRLSRNIQGSAEKIGLQDGMVVEGKPLNGPVVFLENKIAFEADVVKGQKTGFFLDQRENRQEVEKLAPGRRVLNAFSFSGGFSLYAARGGARSVTDLDISSHALEGAKRNFQLNQKNARIAACEHKTIRADVFEWLEESREKFELIIVDPPSLAKREQERGTALKAYGTLNLNAIRHLEKDGILVAASCSAHVRANEFFGAVLKAGGESGRKFAEIQRTFHPADHPAAFPEAEYLKCIYLRFAS